jgi:GntR family transcriptional regulator, transcriptional repressor for pyruvate dehydrogenase complex
MPTDGLPPFTEGFAHTVLSAPRQIAAAIKHDILQGLLKPGDKLPSEDELARLFRVSRPTVRAGLQELRAAAILDVQRGPKGGYRVGNLSLDTLEVSVTESISLSLVVQTLLPAEFFEVRLGLELFTAETAAVRRSEEMLERLERVASSVAAAGGDPRAAFDLDLQFHRALAEAARNPLLLAFEGAMIAVLRRLIGDGASTSPDLTLGGVPEIIAAVREQDAPAAREAMRRHLALSAEYYGVELEPADTSQP